MVTTAVLFLASAANVFADKAPVNPNERLRSVAVPERMAGERPEERKKFYGKAYNLTLDKYKDRQVIRITGNTQPPDSISPIRYLKEEMIQGKPVYIVFDDMSGGAGLYADELMKIAKGKCKVQQSKFFGYSASGSADGKSCKVTTIATNSCGSICINMVQEGDERLAFDEAVFKFHAAGISYYSNKSLKILYTKILPGFAEKRLLDRGAYKDWMEKNAQAFARHDVYTPFTAAQLINNNACILTCLIRRDSPVIKLAEIESLAPAPASPFVLQNWGGKDPDYDCYTHGINCREPNDRRVVSDSSGWQTKVNPHKPRQRAEDGGRLYDSKSRSGR